MGGGGRDQPGTGVERMGPKLRGRSGWENMSFRSGQGRQGCSPAAVESSVAKAGVPAVWPCGGVRVGHLSSLNWMSATSHMFPSSLTVPLHGDCHRHHLLGRSAASDHSGRAGGRRLWLC